MDAPTPTRRFSRRNLFRLIGVGGGLAVTAEALRVFAYTNEHTIIAGRAYRSAQLTPAQLERVIAEKQIRTVLNLRGTCPNAAWYLGECRTTHAAGVSQEDITLSAKRLPAPAEIRRMIEVLDHTEYPIILHCHQGADRTGLVATAILLLQTDSTLDEARRQLWPRYGHVRAGRTVVIDQFFDYYEAWLAAKQLAHTPAQFRHWATSEYSPGAYRAELTLLTAPEARAGQGFTLTIRAKNTSVEPWQFLTGGSGGIQLRYQLFEPGGTKLYKGHAGHLQAVVKPGEHIDLVAGFPPMAAPGRYLVHTDMLDTASIDLHDADFVQYGSEPLVFDVNVK